ncbi:hypothetical protein GJAV_G00274090 [Gymnothorax javanicus]|nr:hypothetical protein GJAV_G00274090 [Gymnothorax javanicus]
MVCICVSPAGSVFGQAEELNGIVGKSIEFPTPVQTRGSLTHKGDVIGDVTSSRLTTPSNEFKGRLQWDSSSGHFTLSELKEADAGEYKVQNTEQKITTVYQLNVYIPVSTPNVSIIHNKYPCKLMCTVDRGTKVTLSWYREGEEEHYSSSGSLDAPYIKLPEAVDRGGTYTCVAKNSVSNLNTSITVGEHCTEDKEDNGLNTEQILFRVLAPVAILIIIVLIALIVYLYHRQSRGSMIGLQNKR